MLDANLELSPDDLRILSLYAYVNIIREEEEDLAEGWLSEANPEFSSKVAFPGERDVWKYFMKRFQIADRSECKQQVFKALWLQRKKEWAQTAYLFE